MYIESSQNVRFKGWKKLLTRKGRSQQQKFILEGFHLAEEALRSDWPLEAIIFTEQTESIASLRELLAETAVPTYTLPSKLFSEISETEAPQGIITIVHKRSYTEQERKKLFQSSNFILLVDQVQDPGNLGTIIRTADAAGVDGIILGKGTTDVYLGKTIRSTQGSIFHLPIFEEENLEAVLNELKSEEWYVLASSLADSVDYRSVEIGDQKTALIVGNEGQGIAEPLLAQAHQKIKIPIWGQAESLNVGVATGILLYHYNRQ